VNTYPPWSTTLWYRIVVLGTTEYQEE